jgi:hypothetical protein
VILPALLAAAALAAAPIKGATYRGTLSGARAKITIRFRVSAGATQVQNLRIASLPIYCSGNGPPGAPHISFANARISASGSFSSRGKDMITTGPLKSSVVATLLITGTFARDGKESGTVTTTYAGTAKQCGGHSTYTTSSG